MTPQESNQLQKVERAEIIYSSNVESFFAKWNDYLRLAVTLAKSGLLPSAYANRPEAVMVVFLRGYELGVPPMESLASIEIISGKTSIKPQLMMALINRSKLLESIKIEDDGSNCSVTMKRIGKDPHTEIFGIKDAEKMETTENKVTIKLSQKFNWRTMPKTMRKWRAISACARMVFPDIISGAYLPEELDPNMRVEGEGEEVNTQEEFFDEEVTYRSLQDKLFKLSDSKTTTVEELNDWKELYKDDIFKLTELHRANLSKLFSAETHRRQPKQVIPKPPEGLYVTIVSSDEKSATETKPATDPKPEPPVA